MIQVHESSSSKHFYPKQALWIYFIPSKSIFIISFHISLGLSLSLFVFSGRLKIPLLYWSLRRVSLDMTKPLQTMLDQLLLNWCYPKFVSYIFIYDSITSYVATYPTQHPHFIYTHILGVLYFYSPTLCVIHHCGFNHHPVEHAF
jgi:hypothetical protein